MTELVKPFININGSDPDRMMEDILAARDKLSEAIKAMKEIIPHGRDYPGRTDLYAKARDQHLDRIRALIKIENEMYEIVEHIYDNKR